MADQRQNWRAFQCREDQMESIAFGPDRILVAPPTRDAWTALANVLLAHNYELRTPDTDSYNCREIKNGGAISLHSFGIALDINWNTNPYQKTPDKRKVRFSGKPTQAERAEDVRLHRADTDMTPEMIADILAIRTNSGQQVFAWGGNWNTIKDTMHFEIAVSPAELASGIDQATARQPAPDATWGTPRGAAGDDSVLAEGAEGPRVRALQAALAARALPVGEIDGDFGPKTLAALKAFQAAQGLPVTGIGDDATLAALGLAAAAPLPQPQQVPLPPQPVTDTAALIDQLIKRLGAADLDRLLKQLGSVAPAPAPAPAPTVPALPPNVAAALVAVLLGKTPAAVPQDVHALKEAVMSPVDRALGGELLMGKKTALSVVALAVMSVLQGTGVAPVLDGAPATTGQSTVQILYTLIMAFGGLGLVGKADRVVNLLGLMAAGARTAARRPG